MKLRSLAAISLLAGGLKAQQAPAPTVAPVGSINSQSPVEINGTPMRPDGAPFWPIVIGDRILVGQSPAFLKLADQNRIEFAPGSQADIKRLNDGRVFVFLRSGDAQFTVNPATLVLCAADTEFVPQRHPPVTLTFRLISGPHCTPLGVRWRNMAPGPATKVACCSRQARRRH